MGFWRTGEGNGLDIGECCFGDEGLEATRASSVEAETCVAGMTMGFAADGLSALSDGGMTVGGVRGARRLGLGVAGLVVKEV